MYIALHWYCIVTTKHLDTDTAVEVYRTTLNISNAASLVVSMSCSKMNCFKAALSCIVYKQTFLIYKAEQILETCVYVEKNVYNYVVEIYIYIVTYNKTKVSL